MATGDKTFSCIINGFKTNYAFDHGGIIGSRDTKEGTSVSIAVIIIDLTTDSIIDRFEHVHTTSEGKDLTIRLSKIDHITLLDFNIEEMNLILGSFKDTNRL